MAKRIGIMGGTFDPIHAGHLITAECVRAALGLTTVLFIPAAQPPHKQGRVVTPAQHRYVMTQLAACSNPHFRVSDIELRRQGPSYTIDTVRELQQIYPADTVFYFIIGADAINELATWHEVDALLTLCHFVTATRQGSELNVTGLTARFGAAGMAHIHPVATPQLEISSTAIRERVRAGLSIRYLVPQAVREYIEKEGLYL